MKTLLTLVLASTTLATAAPALLGRLAEGPSAAAAATSIDAASIDSSSARRAPVSRDWRSDFMQAYKIGDRKGMARIARENDGDVASWILEQAAALTTAPTDEKQKLFEATGRAWTEAFDTAFADNVLGYFEKLDAEERTTRLAIIGEYRDATTKYFNKRGQPMSATRDAELQELGEAFDPIAQKFYDVGDMYYASRAWVFAGDAFSPRAVREEAASAKRELEYLKKGLDACRIFDIGDPTHTQTKSRVNVLEQAVARGAGEGAGAADAGPAALPFEFGPAVEARSEAETFDDVKRRRRLTYGWDEVHPTWPSVWLGDIGSSVTLPGMSGGPLLERIELKEITVTDPDGGVQRVSLSTEPLLIETRIALDGEMVDYSFFAVLGKQVDDFLGFTANLEPTLAGMTIYLKPAAAVGFEIGRDELFVSDDNFDGTFGGAPIDATKNGLPKGVTLPSFDGLFSKRDKLARPFSRIVMIGKQWYRLEANAGGSSFTAAPATDIRTGEVELSYEGPDLEWLVVRGEGALEDVLFALEEGKATELPIGTYRVYMGVVREKDAKAVLLPGESEPFEITEGGELELALGGPFRYDFDSSLTGEGIKVRGYTVRVVGSAGEEYHLCWKCRPRPTLYLRSTGDSGWDEVAPMQLIDDIDTLAARGAEGWNEAWWPDDLVVENEVGDEYDARLFEKKNPLFGRIDSAAE